MRQVEIIWSGFKLVCPKYSLTCVVKRPMITFFGSLGAIQITKLYCIVLYKLAMAL